MARVPCHACTKLAYPQERLSVLGRFYHKACFRCTRCALLLTLATFRVRDREPYCSAHSAANDGEGSDLAAIAASPQPSLPVAVPAVAASASPLRTPISPAVRQSPAAPPAASRAAAPPLPKPAAATAAVAPATPQAPRAKQPATPASPKVSAPSPAPAARVPAPASAALAPAASVAPAAALDVRSELARARELHNAGNWEEERMVYENLLSMDPMPREAVIALASLSGASIEGAARGRIEWRRYTDARIALHLQQAFQGGEEDDLSDALKSLFFPGAAPAPEEDHRAAGNTFPHFDSDASVEALAWIAQMERKGLSLPLVEKRLQIASAAALYEEMLHSRLGEATVAEIYYRLGRMYAFGMGIDVSEPELAHVADLQAHEYLNIAVALAHPGALHLCGRLYSEGRACAYSTTDERRVANCSAVDLLGKAASLDHAPSKKLLAEMYAEGRVGGSNEPDTRKAHFTKASELLASVASERSRLLSRLAASSWACATGAMLASQLFTSYLGDHVAPEAMQHILHDYLRRLGAARGCTYPKTSLPDNVRDDRLLQTLLTDSPVSAGDEKSRGPAVAAVEDPSKGGVAPRGRNMPAAVLKAWVRQYLLAHDERWSAVDAQKVLDDLKPALDVARAFEKDCDDKAPLRVATERIAMLSAATQFPYLRASLGASAPAVAFYSSDTLRARVERAQTLSQRWAELSERSALVFCTIEPPLRTMREQHELYRYAIAAVEMFPEWRARGFGAMLKVAALARDLARDVGDSQSAMPHLLRSAHAVALEADASRVSFAVARKQIEASAAPVLSALPPSLDPRCVGYDILRNLPLLHQLYLDSCRQGRSRMAAERQRILLEEGRREWIREARIGQCFSNPDYTLAKIFDRATVYVRGLPRPPPEQPSVDVLALTYDDPWKAYLDFDLEAEFVEARQQAQQIVGGAKPSLEIYCAVLDQELVTCKQALITALPEPGQKLQLEQIFDKLDAPYDSTASCLVAKQKLLFVLRQLMNGLGRDAHEAFRVAQVMLCGLGGRCEDGHSVWVDQQLSMHVMQRALNGPAGHSPEAKTRSLQMHVGALMIAVRRRFIEQHLSPFLKGTHEITNVEQRTAMPALLTQALRLPLSLPGRLTPVKYPAFAFGNVEMKEADFTIETLMQRFLFGGEITFKDGNTTVVVPFEGHSLCALGRELRLACVDVDNLAEARRPMLAPLPGRRHARCANAHAGESEPAALPGQFLCAKCLLQSDRSPPATAQFLIPDKLVRAFVEVDPVLGPYWALFTGSHYTQSNSFFDADGAQRAGGNLMRNVLCDAGILRILEVCGYATVPDGFYRSVPHRWHLPTEQADVSRIDFRVGRISDATQLVKSDEHYEVTIDLGEDEPRTAITTVGKHVPCDVMRGKLVLVVANSRPKKVRGVATNALLLAANYYEGPRSKSELLCAPAGSLPGERVMVSTVAGVADDPYVDGATLERVAVRLRTNDARIVTHQELPFVSHRGAITSQTLKYCPVRW